MAIQPITYYARDTGQEETVFTRTRPARAENTNNVFARRGDSYTVNRRNTATDTVTTSRNSTGIFNRNTTGNNTRSNQNTQLTASIRRNAGLYQNAGPRQIAEQSLFTSQTQSTNILTNLTNTFGTLFNTGNTSARQSTENTIRNFASLYSSAGPRLLNTGTLFSNSSFFSNSSSRTTTVAPQITFLRSIQSYISTGLSNNILGGGLNLLA